MSTEVRRVSDSMRYRAVRTLSLALALGAIAPITAQSPPAQVTVLRAARMIDGTGAAPVVPAMIRVEGERIVEVGTSVRIPAGAARDRSG